MPPKSSGRDLRKSDVHGSHVTQPALLVNTLCVNTLPPETLLVFNISYLRWSQDNSNRTSSQKPKPLFQRLVHLHGCWSRVSVERCISMYNVFYYFILKTLLRFVLDCTACLFISQWCWVGRVAWMAWFCFRWLSPFEWGKSGSTLVLERSGSSWVGSFRWPRDFRLMYFLLEMNQGVCKFNFLVYYGILSAKLLLMWYPQIFCVQFHG